MVVVRQWLVAGVISHIWQLMLALGCALSKDIGQDTSHGLSMWPGFPHSRVAGFQDKDPKRKTDRSHITLYDLALDIMWCHFCYILFVNSKSLRLALIHGKRDQIPPLDGKSSKEFEDMFKTTIASDFLLNTALCV